MTVMISEYHQQSTEGIYYEFLLENTTSRSRVVAAEFLVELRSWLVLCKFRSKVLCTIYVSNNHLQSLLNFLF